MIKRTRLETFVFWFYVALLAGLVVFFAATALSCTAWGAGAVSPRLARTGEPASVLFDLNGPTGPGPGTHSTRKELVGVHHREA